MQRISRQLAIVVLGCAVAVAAAGEAARADQRADRRTAERFSEQLPSPPEGWSVVRTEKLWRRDGARVRRIYRGPEGRGIRIVIEARTRGLMYKSDLLDDPERARQYGYSIARLAAGGPGGEDSGQSGDGTATGEQADEEAGNGDDGNATTVDALVKSAGSETEIRFWLDNRILVLLVGDATRRELEAFVARMDLGRLAAVQ